MSVETWYNNILQTGNHLRCNQIVPTQIGQQNRKYVYNKADVIIKKRTIRKYVNRKFQSNIYFFIKVGIQLVNNSKGCKKLDDIIQTKKGYKIDNHIF